jgi:hypothetical protein
MTISTIPSQTINTASDQNFKKAVSILNQCFTEIPENPNLDEVFDFAQQAVHELCTDIDFCDNKHEASLHALEWLFQELYQKNLPLEKFQFFSLCKDLIIPQLSTKKEGEGKHWYEKI